MATTISNPDRIESALDDLEFLTRSVNRATVLTVLVEHPIERNDMVEATGVSRPTLSRILDDLGDQGWVTVTKQRYETTALGEFVERETTPKAKLLRLLDIVVMHSRRNERDPEIAVRAWAHQGDAVCEVQERVDGRRVAYVRSLCHELGVDDERALRMAHLLYAVLVGCEQMYPPIRGDGFRVLFDEYLRLYTTSIPRSRATEGRDG